MFVKLASSNISHKLHRVKACGVSFAAQSLGLGLSNSRSIFVRAWRILVSGQPDSAIFAPCGKPTGQVICQVSYAHVQDQLFRVILRSETGFLEDQPSAACSVKLADEVKSQCLC
jgi:hypothetical protein